MVRFIIKVFVVIISSFSCNVLKCVSMNNQECKVRPEVINKIEMYSTYHVVLK